jgi:hypothetical protein
MSSTTSNVSPRQDTYWWQGSVMEIKARAENAGGALGVLEGRADPHDAMLGVARFLAAAGARHD